MTHGTFNLVVIRMDITVCIFYKCLETFGHKYNKKYNMKKAAAMKS